MAGYTSRCRFAPPRIPRFPNPTSKKAMNKDDKNSYSNMYKVQLLNYDSKWVTYAESPTYIGAYAAEVDLQQHNFKDFQIRIRKA